MQQLPQASRPIQNKPVTARNVDESTPKLSAQGMDAQVQTLPPFWDPGVMPIPRDASFLHACREADALLQLVTQVCH